MKEVGSGSISQRYRYGSGSAPNVTNLYTVFWDPDSQNPNYVPGFVAKSGSRSRPVYFFLFKRLPSSSRCLPSTREREDLDIS
jgi:hypothetical protein